MFDLKAKLAAAGAVTEKQVKDLEAKSSRGRKRRGSKPGSTPAKPGKPKLQGQHRGESYDLIRRYVERHRLDTPSTIPAEGEQRFHFQTESGAVGHLYLDEDTRNTVTGGNAGIVSFMSHHGLAHCVLPKAHALRVAEVFPNWIRRLEGYKAPAPPAATESSKAENESS